VKLRFFYMPFCLLLGVLFSLSGLAQSLAASENNQSLERLFTTLKERKVLDRARLNYIANSPQTLDSSSDDSNDKSLTGKKEPKVVLNGFITRSDGKSVVWINDSNTMGEELDKQGIKVNTKKMKRNLIQFSVPGRKVSMKPGQAVDIENGKVIEVYNLPKKEQKKSQVDRSLSENREPTAGQDSSSAAIRVLETLIQE